MKKFAGKFYKFLNKEHAHLFLGGSIRMGGFDTYSLLEIITGDKWIGDREESRSVTRLDSLSWYGYSVKHSNIFSFTAGYCLSLSVGDFAELSKAMSDSVSPYRYDACIEISDMTAFIFRLGCALKARFPNFRSMGFDAQPVVYSDSGNLHDATHMSDFHEHNTFSKPSRYSEQKEFRIINTMDEDDQMLNYLDLAVGNISDIAKAIDLPPVASSWSEPFKLTETDAKHSILATLRLLRDIGGEGAERRDDAIDKLIYAYGCLRFKHPENWRIHQLDKSIILYDVDRRIPFADRVTRFSMHGET